MLKNFLIKKTGLCLLSCIMIGCSSGPGPALSQIEPIYDPYESWNRSIFSFNNALDEYALAPVAHQYKEATPDLIQLLVKNELDYIQLPVSFFNAILQGNGDIIEHVGARFFINTFAGGIGLLDPASEFGYPPHIEDFGQTLAVWGLEDGRYYMAPIFGPLTLRDVGGRIVDFFINPFSYISNQFYEFNVAERALSVVNFRSQNADNIDNLKNSTEDYYASVRSIYLQSRNGDISNSDLVPNDAFIDFSVDE